MKVFHGLLCHSLTSMKMEIKNGFVVVNNKGFIEKVESYSTEKEKQELLSRLKKEYKLEDGAIRHLSSKQFLIPGFVDTHVHAPQYVFTGTGYDRPLLDWLDTYTFPRESEFQDVAYAKDTYTKVVRRLLRCGTTTASYFATIHREATEQLADIVEATGQRAFIGKVNMDRFSPDTYIEMTADSVADTQAVVNYIQNKNNPLVQAIVTPRFAISCTPQLMKEVAHIAQTHQLLIQTHISENCQEIDFVRELFPEQRDYLDVYDQAGLITSRTILAHGIYLGDRELDVIKQRNAGISHCPASNFCLKSGVLDVRRLLDKGIKVGLGTDVSGGPQPSILDAIRQAKTASAVVKMHQRGHSPSVWHGALSLEEVFYLATLGGAQVLNLETVIGNFMPGKAFDALLVDLEEGNDVVDIFPHDQPSDMISKFLMLGDDRNIKEVYVAGRQVV